MVRILLLLLSIGILWAHPTFASMNFAFDILEKEQQAQESFPEYKENLLLQQRELTAADIFSIVKSDTIDNAYQCGGIAGMNKYISTIYGRSPIHYAALEDDSLVIKQLLVENPQLVHLMDNFMATPLILAAKAGYKDNVVVLLDAGANPLHHDALGRTAYDWAHYFQYPDIENILHHAMSNEQNRLNKTLLENK